MEIIRIQDMTSHLVKTVTFLLFLLPITGASYCTDEQVDTCKNAVRAGTLEELPGGGECQVKQYVQYTHLCTVSNYMPSVDYCCCAHAHKVLCCRYHYDWNYFRCAESEDTVDVLSIGAQLPFELLIAVVVAPIVLAACCVVCCVKRFCCNEDEDDTCCKACMSCGRKNSGRHNKATTDEEFQRYPPREEDEAHIPLNCNSSKTPLCSDTIPHKPGANSRGGRPASGDAPQLVPSAPPHALADHALLEHEVCGSFNKPPPPPPLTHQASAHVLGRYPSSSPGGYSSPSAHNLSTVPPHSLHDLQNPYTDTRDGQYRGRECECAGGGPPRVDIGSYPHGIPLEPPPPYEAAGAYHALPTDSPPRHQPT